MKRKIIFLLKSFFKKYFLLKSEPENSLTGSPRKVLDSTCSYLPDECWESVFRFIDNSDDLNSLSLVSTHFLSITDRLRFSLTVNDQRCPFLDRILKRFTNLNSLDLSGYKYDLDNLLCEISRFPLKKLTSLNISYQKTFPANGLRVFSQNIITLTSLSCSHTFLYNNELLLIADCFPLLKELNLGFPFVSYQTNFINGIHSLLSKRCIQHLDLTCTYFLNDQHVAELSLFLPDLVSINLSACVRLTESALFSLVRKCPSLSGINMENTDIGKESLENYNSLGNYVVSSQLKSLCLARCKLLRDDNIIMFASTFPNLELLDLSFCNRIIEGICQVLKRCCKIRHLNLAGCSRVKIIGINFVVPMLEVLDLSFTKIDDETLYMISRNCCGLVQLLLKHCDNVTEKGVKHVVENCTQLREHECLL